MSLEKLMIQRKMSLEELVLMPSKKIDLNLLTKIQLAEIAEFISEHILKSLDEMITVKLLLDDVNSKLRDQHRQANYCSLIDHALKYNCSLEKHMLKHYFDESEFIKFELVLKQKGKIRQEQCKFMDINMLSSECCTIMMSPLRV